MRYTTIGTNSAARKVSVLSLARCGSARRPTKRRRSPSWTGYAWRWWNFIDTSNNYLFFVNGTQGGESEALLGRWRASRGAGDEIVIATKVGARPVAPSSDFATPREGLSRAAIREASERSRERLGVARIDLYYAGISPIGPEFAPDQQVAAFGELVADGAVGLLGLSNHWAWQVERARSLAAAAGRARADVLQYHHTYLRIRAPTSPTWRSSTGRRDRRRGRAGTQLRRAPNPGMTLVAYSPLLNGAYTRPEKKLDRAYDHPGTRARLQALDRVARETVRPRGRIRSCSRGSSAGNSRSCRSSARPRSRSSTRAWPRSTWSSAPEQRQLL